MRAFSEFGSRLFVEFLGAMEMIANIWTGYRIGWVVG